MKISSTKRLFLLFLYLGLSLNTEGQNYPLIDNVAARAKISLNGEWQYIVDPMVKGVSSKFYLDETFKGDRYYGYSFDDALTLMVPGDWNNQRKELLNYEGNIWYRKVFNLKLSEEERYFLYFGAVNYKATVYLNGEKMGEHEGGYTPFNFEISEFVKNGENHLIVLVDNIRKKERVPELTFDWWNYGGILSDVKILETPKSFISNYRISLSRDRRFLEGYAKVDGVSRISTVHLKIPEKDIDFSFKVDSLGLVKFRIKKEVEFWTPQSPKLYEVIFDFENVTIRDTIGFRTIEKDGNKILLNGEPIFLKGANVHAQLLGKFVWNNEQIAELNNMAEDLGCNFLRLVHYPHSENMIKMMDKMGILVWEEIPVYWKIDWSNESTLLNAENQLKEIIERDKNRASVIIWSVANETPKEKSRTQFIKKLISVAKNKDNTRLVGAALDRTQEIKKEIWGIEDELIDYLDIVGVNQYYGWFQGNPEVYDKMRWEFNFNKPVIMTEFGASTLQGFFGDKFKKYTEDYQSFFYEKNFEMIDQGRMMDLSGICPWSLVEHRSPLRMLSGIEDGYSRAGLISIKGIRKRAFYTVKKWYSSIK